jgi:hypothetical protein
MKKVLVAGAALMLAGGLAMPVMAADPGVSITGDARGRVIYRDAYNYNAYNAPNRPDLSERFLMDSRLRFNVKGTSAGGAYVLARVRVIDGTFNGEPSPADATNVWADKAYLSIPMGDAFTFEIGKNRVAYGNGFLYDDISVEGIRGIYGSMDDLRIIGFYEIKSEGSVSADPQDNLEDNDAGRFGGVVDIKANPDWHFGFMAAYQYDDRVASDAEGFFGSVFTRGKVDNFAIQAELAWIEDELLGATDDGVGGYARGSYTMDALTLSADLGFTQDGYVADPFYGFVMIGGEWATQAMTFGQEGDWLWGALSSKYQVSEDLFLVGNLIYADVDSTTPAGLDSALEVSGMLQYNIVPGANLQWRIGYLQPSYDNVNDDSVFGTVARFNISF